MGNNGDALGFNGINCTTGKYLTTYSEAKLIELITGVEQDTETQPELTAHVERPQPSFGTTDGIDETDLAQTGWGIVFAAQDAALVPAIKEALKPLLDRRRQQAGGSYAEGGLYAEFESDPVTGWRGVRKNQTKAQWAAKHGLATGQPVNPSKGVPYYLLLVGSPAVIPFRFQYQLSIEHAVGRIHFETIDEYAQYAANVVAAEEDDFRAPRKATFFAPENEGDEPTKLSANMLVKPLAKLLQESDNVDNWDITTFVGDGEATKAKLTDLAGGDATPGLLFTASHGAGFNLGDNRMLHHQGALITQEWSGEDMDGTVSDDLYFSADDVASDANMLGSVAFHFACYGAGTPEFDNFQEKGVPRVPIAPHPFLAKLPQRLLTQGALAVLGHVERAWGYSFIGAGTSQLDVFQSPLEAMMRGVPVGHAAEYIDSRWAALATEMLGLKDDYIHGAKTLGPTIARKWTQLTDARNYMIVGDPAVRLQPADSADSAPQTDLPTVETSIVVVPPATVTAEVAEASFVFGGGGNSAETGSLRSAITNFIDKLTTTVAEFTSDVSSLDIKTYVADDLNKIEFERGKFTGATKPTLAAQTHVTFGGDQTELVSGDDTIRDYHQQSVAQAQAHRAELLKTLLSAAGGLVSAE